MRPRGSNLRQLFLARPKSPRPQGTEDPAASAALQAIWDVVAMIPQGRVRTYGDVARVAGFAGHARQAGYALRIMPPHMHLPWHRVGDCSK